ncbi:unnamed protein product [Kluyveromyces dobzhanskii CBS 2104]|uniref:WGS project CCBQ000000000 data, contig 00012 n=1 Tax=Kluyveromyces dobzhanskii CBS 2104 TaxID=1427455 RepID=A0A0A8L2R0_9SACH|nr:unnamed protein product [Kluyveromyces dobzhanskii CBS 2104]
MAMNLHSSEWFAWAFGYVQRMLVILVVAWLLLNCLLYLSTGCYALGFNPVTLHLRRVKIKGKLRIKSVRYNIWKHSVLLESVEWVARPPSRETGEKQSDEIPRTDDFTKEGLNEDNCRLLPQKLSKWMPFVGRRLNKLNIVVDQATVGDFKIDSAVVKIGSDGNDVGLDINFQGVTVRGKRIVENTVFISHAVIDVSRPFPFKDINIELKVRDMSVPVGPSMLALYKLRHGKVPDQLEKVQSNPLHVELPSVASRKEKILNDDDSNEWDIEEVMGKFNKKIERFYKISSSFEKIDILFDSPLFTEIPFKSNLAISQRTQAIQFQVTASTIVVSLSRSAFSDPGTKVHFDVDERPVKISTFITQLKLSTRSHKENCKEVEETRICQVPSISLYGDSNLFCKRTFAPDDTKVFANTVLNLIGHITSPVIDIDIEKLSLLLSVQRNLKVLEDLISNDPIKEPLDLNQIFQKVTRKGKFLEYFQNYLPHTEFKCTVEDSLYIVSNGLDSLIHKISMVSFRINSNRLYIKADKKLFYTLDTQMEVSEWSCYHQNKEKLLKQPVFAFSSIMIGLKTRILPSLAISVTVGIDTFTLDLTNLETLVVLNNTIRQRTMKLIYVEETYFKKIFSDLETRLAAKIDYFKKSQKESCPLKAEEILFKDVPAFFQFFKVVIKKVDANVGSRSVFIERKDYVNPKFETVHDFVNGDMRKISYTFDEVKLIFARSNDSQHNNDESSSASTHFSFESLASNDMGLGHAITEPIDSEPGSWSLAIDFSEFNVDLYSETKNNNLKLISKRVFKLPSIKVFVYPDHDINKIKASINVSDVEILFSLMTVFLFVSSIYNLKMVFRTDLYGSTRDCLVSKHIRTLKQLNKHSLVCFDRDILMELIELECNFDRISNTMLLPNGVRTKLEFLDSSLVFLGPHSITLSGHYSRLMVESPILKNTWMRMISIVNYAVAIDTSVIKENGEKAGITLSNETWQWAIPHRFEMYRLFDNISTTFKSIKQMLHSLGTESNESVIDPKITHPTAIPKIKVKSSRWIFSVEDDPFESELNLLLQLGAREQKERLEKYSIFKKQVEMQFKKTDDKVLRKSASFASEYSASHKRLLRSHSTSSLHMMGIDDSDLGKANWMAEQIKDEYDRLMKNISKSWITRVKKHRSLLKNHFAENFEFLWGHLDVTKIPSDFNKNVLDFISAPALMNLIFEDIDIDLKEPSFGISKIPDFVYQVGKNVPKETQYSIMIPLNLNANFSEIRCHLKDYPLPAFHFPKDHTETKATTVNLSGDLLITEDMIHSKEELRTIYVPLVPSAHLEDSQSLYALFVPRTLTAIKLYTDIKLKITSQDNARFLWGGSYSGAIQQTMKCFDNFSKPPIDPSPAVGFWDKIRNMFHARILITIPNSCFEVALKGDKNPYKIGGMSAGYALIFKDNVEIFCNKDDNPQKFLMVTASELSFSIPNFFAKPIPVWNMPSEQSLFFPAEEFSNLQQNAAFFYLLGSSKMPKDRKKVDIMRETYIEKTAIKLTGGMQLNVGIMFERQNQENNTRTMEFKPHHNFRLCNPIYIPKSEAHDSFAGFRSDFIHLSFELISKSKDAYNCMQLTPNAFKIFFKWWGTFSGNLPVRKGPLFTDERFSPKFGAHLYTISYRAEVYPLFICHVAPGLDPKTLLDPSVGVQMFGLKAKMSEFSMDLHQRKEIFHEYKEHLNITKRKTSLKFHEADVTTTDIDIRTVFASFVKSEYAKGSSPDINIFDEDPIWFDIDDFTEFGSLSEVTKSVPTVLVKPLLFSPMFAYKKIAPYGDKYQVDLESFEPIQPFNNAKYHDCNLRKYVEIPDRLVTDRHKIFLEEKSKVEGELESSDETDNSKLKVRLNMIERTIKQLELMKKDINYLNAEYERADNDSDIPHTSSKDLNLPILNFMKSAHNSNKKYANKFIVVSMLLKWNEEVRNVLLKYMHRLSLISDMNNVTKLKTLQTLDSLINKNKKSISTISEEGGESTNGPESDTERAFRSFFHEDKDPDEILSSFQNDIKVLAGDFDYKVFEKHHVQLIGPQIQLTTITDPDACILVTAPTIKINSLCFDSNVSGNEYQQNLFMRRTGVLLINSNVFVFHKKEQESYGHLLFDNFLYGSTHETSWRPWLGMELCFDPDNLKDNMLISNFTSVFTYDQVLAFAKIPESLKQSNVLKNRISCDLPRIVIESNSARYLSLFNLVTNLLLYVEPESAKMKEDIKKMVLGFNFEDLTNVRDVIFLLEKEIDVLGCLESEYSFRKHLLDNAEVSDLNTIRYNKFDTVMKMLMIMKVLTSASPEQTNNEDMLLVVLKAKEIILHMLDDDGKNFLDVAVADMTFQRMESTSGYNFNRVTVGIGQVINLSHDALFHDILSPVKKELEEGSDPFIDLQWEKNKAVGGIQVIKNVRTNLQDLKVSVEQPTIEKIIAWVSPSSVSLLIDASSQSDSNSDEDDDMSSTVSSSNSSVHTSTANRKKSLQYSVTQSPTEVIFPVDDMLGDDMEMEEMIRRAKDNMIIENININSFLMIVSYQGTGAKRLINVTDFNLNFPVINFVNQTMTILELMMHLKKVLIKSLLRHTGKFISNKLKRHKSIKRLKKSVSSPLKQLNYYSHYTAVDELESTYAGSQKNGTTSNQKNEVDDSQNETTNSEKNESSNSEKSESNDTEKNESSNTQTTYADNSR